MKTKTKNLLPGFLSGLLLSTSLIPAAINTNSYAEGASSFFDWNAQQCIIDNYNSLPLTGVSRIEDVNFEKITTLNCNNRDITNIRGLTLMPNLEELYIHTNPELRSLDLSNNKKLRVLDIEKTRIYDLDISNNPELETFYGSATYYGDKPVKTIAYVEKSDRSGFKYKMDLSKLKFWDDDLYVTDDDYETEYDPETKTVYFKDEVPGYSMKTSEEYRIRTRIGYMRYEIFLEGDEEVETHNPFYVNHDCEKRTNEYGSWYSCDNSVYAGEELDTDKIIDDTLKKIFNLDDYELSEVKIVPPTANIELTKDEDTLKQGKILPEADFVLEFHFELKKPKAPDTGFFTNRDGSVNVSNVLLALAGLSISAFAIIFLAHRLSKKAKAKRF